MTDEQPHDERSIEEIKRGARERARFLQRKTDLTEREALAFAFAKLGFSPAGVATRTGFGQGSVERYLERVAVAYGHETAYQPAFVERDDDVEPVTEDEVMSYHERTKRWWLSAAADHPDMAPEWARDRLGIDDTEAANNGRKR